MKIFLTQSKRHMSNGISVHCLEPTIFAILTYCYLFTWRFGEDWWEVDVNSKVMVILHVAFSPKTNCINISSIEPINFRWDQVCPILGHHLIIYLIILQNYYPSSPSQSTQWKIQKNLFKNLKSFFLWIVVQLN